MFALKNHSRCPSILEKTTALSQRTASTNKKYLKLVTPSMHHPTLIRPVEEIKIVSCQHKKDQYILPLQQLLKENQGTGIKNWGHQRKRKERTERKQKSSEKYRKQPKVRKENQHLEKKQSTQESPSASRLREESPIHRLMEVSKSIIIK